MIDAEWICGNLFIRPHTLAKGEVIHGHKHNFDHMSLVIQGAVRVRAQVVDKQTGADWLERVFETGQHCLIRAGVEHQIESLKKNTKFWCIYAHRTPQGTVTQEYDGWTPAYE